jgi:hypothetical protein
MADGIRINDAALEISPAALDAIVKGQGAQVTLTKVDLSVSPEALNTILAAATPQGTPAPSASVGDGRLQVTGQAGERRVALDIRAGSFRLQITSEGLRLVSE